MTLTICYQVKCNYSVIVMRSTSAENGGLYCLDFADPADSQMAARFDCIKIWKNMAKLFIVPDKQFDRCQRKKDPQGLPVCLRGISVPVPNVLAIACSPMDSERRPFDRTI